MASIARNNPIVKQNTHNRRKKPLLYLVSRITAHEEPTPQSHKLNVALHNRLHTIEDTLNLVVSTLEQSGELDAAHIISQHAYSVYHERIARHLASLGRTVPTSEDVPTVDVSAYLVLK